MAGRLPWILAGAAAIVGGMMVQDGDWFDSDDVRHEERVERGRDARADGGRVRVTVAGERRGEVDPETVRAMADAVGDLVKAEAALAIAEAGDDAADIRSSRERRDRARARVDQLKADIQRQAGEAADEGRDSAARDIARQEIQSEVREAVRGR